MEYLELLCPDGRGLRKVAGSRDAAPSDRVHMTPINAYAMRDPGSARQDKRVKESRSGLCWRSGVGIIKWAK